MLITGYYLFCYALVSGIVCLCNFGDMYINIESGKEGIINETNIGAGVASQEQQNQILFSRRSLAM